MCVLGSTILDRMDNAKYVQEFSAARSLHTLLGKVCRFKRLKAMFY